jgi:hypothetical protein
LLCATAAANGCFQQLDTGAAKHTLAHAAAEADSDAGPTVALDTPPIVLADGNTAADACSATRAQAMDILQRDCARCHGGQSPGARQGQPPFDFVLDSDRLTQAVSATAKDLTTMQPARFLVPGDPDHSRIYVRPAMGEMPPPDVVGLPKLPRPGASELSVLRQWIAHCLGGDMSGIAGAGATAGSPSVPRAAGTGGTGGNAATHSDPTHDDPPAMNDPALPDPPDAGAAQAPPAAAGSAGSSDAGPAAGGGGMSALPGAPNPPETACSGLCSNPARFKLPPSYQANLGSNESCHETSSGVSAWSCSNFDNRSLRINGTRVTCASLPNPGDVPMRNGGYCFEVGGIDRQTNNNRQNNNTSRNNNDAQRATLLVR